MKRIILLLSILITSLNLYSQQDLVKRENILIISELTNEICTDIENVYPKFFEKEYFKFSQISPETMFSPNKNISAIIETPYKFETKFGKTEKIELKEYEIKYFYDEDGLLKQIQNKSETTELKIGKFGELIKKQISYETNTFGISKITKYDDEGKVLTRYEILYSPKGQIVKINSFDKNSTSKKHTKTFEYDNFGKLIKSMLFENFNDEIKIIPRRNIVNNYFNNSLITKSTSNSFAEGVNELNDFSKVSATKNNNYYQKTVSIRNKTIQEIKTDIQKRWIESPIFYEFIFLKEREINNWDEKKIFNKLYNQTTEKELIYSIKRKYINKEELEQENNISEIREKLNAFIDDIESNEILKTNENSMRFASLNVKIEDFCRWIRNHGEYSLLEDNNCSKEIVDYYKYNSYNLVKIYKPKVDKNLSTEELNIVLNEITIEYQKIIDQTIQKIKNRKVIVDCLLKDKLIYRLYKNPKIAGSPTFASNSRDPYEGFKKEDLYYTYRKLYKSITSGNDINKHLELYQIQEKLIYLEPLNTKKLEKTLRKEKNEVEIVKAILTFQTE